MRILLCTVPYRPSIGGIESVSEILADGFHRAGHEVRVATQTPAAGRDSEPFTILRRPSLRVLRDAVSWAEVVLHNNISLRFAWPLLTLRRPWVIAHHMWCPRSGAGMLAGRMKHFAMRFADNIAVSDAMAKSLSVAATVIPNPYADDLFAGRPDPQRSLDLVYVGRLVSSKGVSVLLDALAVLRNRGDERTLTIIGGGPEEAALRNQTERLRLSQQVTFVGFLKGQPLVDMMHLHRIMVVPSIGDEPFGIVALEGIACGLVLVGTRSGGLPDAIGPCGLVVAPANSTALADAIGKLGAEPGSLSSFRREAPRHLARHTRNQVVRAYLDVIERAARAK